jgi:hypothetical protein
MVVSSPDLMYHTLPARVAANECLILVLDVTWKSKTKSTSSRFILLRISFHDSLFWRSTDSVQDKNSFVVIFCKDILI